MINIDKGDIKYPLFLGTDIGTYGTKSCLVDASGKILATSFIETDILTPRLGWAEQWPDVWWRAYRESVVQIIKKSSVNPSDIAGISISGFSPSIISVDKYFKPIRPALIWMDRRAVEEASWVKKTIGEDEIFKKTGNVIDPYFGFPKVLWLKRKEPNNWRKVHKIFSTQGYIIYKLSNTICIDHSTAGNFGGIYDIHKREWCESLMDELGIPPSVFPEKINMSKDVVGEVSKEAAELTGLHKGTPIVAGGVDAPVSALAATALGEGDFVSMIGTSMCNGVIQEKLRLSRKLVSYPYVAYDLKMTYSYTGISTAGAILRWFRDNLIPYEKSILNNYGLPTYKLLDRLATKVSPGANGLVFMPHMSIGERAPFWSSSMRSCLFGLTLSHAREHIYRAFLEAVAYALKYCMEIIMEIGLPIRRIILVDGGARSQIWRQIIADVIGRIILYKEDVLGAPLGDALLAAVGTGYATYEKINEWVNIDQAVHPNLSNTSIYEKYYKLYLKLYECLDECYELAEDLNLR